jgi:hypothetical protein
LQRLLIVIQKTACAQTSWDLTGNAGTNSANNFLGTTDNKPLVLRTKNIARLRITNTGNVGIGVSCTIAKITRKREYRILTVLMDTI